jgi:hypothetical protein
MRRTITRLAIVATALCSIVLISFPSFPSTLGIVFKPQLVDRALKGDRLTIAPASKPPGGLSWRRLSGVSASAMASLERLALVTFLAPSATSEATGAKQCRRKSFVSARSNSSEMRPVRRDN